MEDERQDDEPEAEASSVAGALSMRQRFDVSRVLHGHRHFLGSLEAGLWRAALDAETTSGVDSAEAYAQAVVCAAAAAARARPPRRAPSGAAIVSAVRSELDEVHAPLGERLDPKTGRERSESVANAAAGRTLEAYESIEAIIGEESVDFDLKDVAVRRCPACGREVMEYARQTRSADEGMTWTRVPCPCESQGDSGRDQRRKKSARGGEDI